MPKRSNVQMTTPDATPNSDSTVYPLPTNNRPLYPWDGPEVTDPVGIEAPYPGDLTAGDGASRDFRPEPKTTGYSTNVPQPDNKGPVKNSGDQGLGVM